MPFLLLVLIFISTFIFLYVVLGSVFIKAKSIERLNKYFSPYDIDGESAEDKENKKEFQLRKFLNELGTKLSEIMLMKNHMKNHMKKNQDELIKAGLPLKAEELLGVQVICLVTISSLIYTLTRSAFTSILLGLMAWLLPLLIVKLRKKKRYKLFNEQLGDAITLISNSLKAGYSFLQAIDSVATEMPPPISDEFKKLLRELRLGVETEKALNNILTRIESDDFELLITAVMIQREIGGNLSEILDNISSTIRERIKLKGEIKTLTAQGRISGIIVSILPIALGLLLYIINPGYIKTLWSSDKGLIIIGISVINQLIGILIIRKIIQIEV